PEDLAQGLTNLSTYHYVAGHLDSSLALAREAYERYGEAGYPESQEFGVALNQLGLVLFAIGRAPEAEPYMARAVALRRKLFGADAVAAIGLNNLGLIRDAQGDIDGAIARFREADEIFLGSPQREYFERGIVLANLAGEMLLKGELAEAERTAREGVGVYQRTVGPDHPNLGITLLRLAQIELASGRPRDALATHRSAVQRFRQFGPTHPDVARSQSYGAEILLALGRLDQAEQSVRLALETRRAVYATTDWRIAETERVLGRVLAARGKTAEAREYLRRARDNFQATMGPDDPRTRAAAGDLDALPGGADPAS
ncbi:MAG: tetratricopeptide repeat protein, partial [Gemmatimonadales bacterium]